MKIVSWFSAGVSSAIATKLAVEKYPDLQIIYIDIDDQHKDSIRFVKDCERWFGKEILILKSIYKNVNDVCETFGWINGIHFAKCSSILKKRVRKEWELENNPTHYVWGFDCSKRELNRKDRLVKAMPQFTHLFPLIDNNITKEMAHGMLQYAGIKRPMMYDLGYPNNNCIGCVKGGIGYWNKIKIDFPNVFQERIKLEETVGSTCIKGIYLKDLPIDKGRNLEPILEDCGIFCEIKSLVGDEK